MESGSKQFLYEKTPEIEAHQRLVSIYETVRDVIFHVAVEPEGRFRFVTVNAAFLTVTGLSPELVVGKTVDEVIPEPSLTVVLDKYRQAIEGKTAVLWEETSDYPTGRLTGEVSVVPVFDDKGACTHLVGSVHDITERKQAEVALRASEQRLKRAERLAHVGNWHWDLKGDTVSWSDEMFRIFGRPHDHTPSYDDILQAIVPQDRERLERALTNCLVEKLGFSVEAQIARPNGELRAITCIGEVTLDEDGSLMGISGATQDITDLKKNEARLSQSQEDLRALTARLVELQESGTKELARELHDDLSQKLAALGLEIATLLPPLAKQSQSLTARVRALQQRITSMADDVHSVSRRLHPAIIEELGLEAALREECWHFSDRTGIAVQFESRAESVWPSAKMSLCFYRVAQEALHNIAKHACATDVHVRLS